MKRIVLGLLLMSGVAGAACNGPYCWTESGPEIQGSLTGGIGLNSKTLAQMNAYTPLAAGVMIYVNDAVNSRVCVSTGAATGAFVVANASGTFTGTTYPHCN